MRCVISPDQSCHTITWATGIDLKGRCDPKRANESFSVGFDQQSLEERGSHFLIDYKSWWYCSGTDGRHVNCCFLPEGSLSMLTEEANTWKGSKVKNSKLRFSWWHGLRPWIQSPLKTLHPPIDNPVISANKVLFNFNNNKTQMLTALPLKHSTI